MPLRSLQPDYGGRQSMESSMDAQSSRENTKQGHQNLWGGNASGRLLRGNSVSDLF